MNQIVYQIYLPSQILVLDITRINIGQYMFTCVMNETLVSAHVYTSYLQYKEINKRALYVIKGMLRYVPHPA